MNKKHQDIFDTISELIKFKSTADNPNELIECAEWVKNKLKPRVPVALKKHNKIPVLVAGQTNLQKTDILLLGHLDVVPADEKQFIPKFKESKIYGRGATDNKGPSAVLIELIEEVYEHNKNISLALVFDEEIGSKYGSNKLKSLLGNNLKIVILPDAGNNYRICIGTFGVWQFKITAKGKSVHASDYHQGENAVEKLLHILIDLTSLYDDKNEEFELNSLNIGLIKGGTATNVVPDKASAEIDIRYQNLHKLKEFQSLVEKLIKKNSKIEVNNIILIEPFKANKNNEVFRKFGTLIKNKTGKEEYFIETSSNDARFFNNKNLAVLITKPKGGGAHTNKEWVDVDSCIVFYDILKGFLLNR